MTTDSILAPVASLTLPDSAALAGRAQQALAFIQSFEVDSADTYALAADELRAIKQRANAIEEQRVGITGPINKALKAINDLFRGPADLLAQAERLLKSKMLAWDQEQQRKADAARREAEAAAEAERRRLAEEAAARQREAEQRQAAAQAANDAGDAQQAQLELAAAHRANAEAQASAVAAQMVVAPVTIDTTPKVKGISTATRVDFEVVDVLALVRHIAAHPELIALVKADEVKLRAYVRGLGPACALPGVRVFEAQSMRASA